MKPRIIRLRRIRLIRKNYKYNPLNQLNPWFKKVKFDIRVCNLYRIFILVIFCFFVFCLAPLFLSGQDINLGGANSGEYWSFIDKSLDSANYKDHFEDKLKLSLNYRDLTLRGVFFIFNPSRPNLNRLQYIDYLVEYNNEPISLVYGTYYTTLGRGLALNQFLDEDFKTDNSIYGVKVRYLPFAINHPLYSEISILAGRPRNIFFEENTYKIKNDTSDQIRGINFETKSTLRHLPFAIGYSIGGRYVRYNRKIDLTPKAFTELFGGNIGITIGPYEGYIEYARQLGCHLPLGGRLTGDGLLFTSNLSFSGLGISFQIMNYDSIGFGGINYRYNEPPTSIKSGISVNQGTDEIGYGLSINYSPLDNLNIEINQNKITTHNRNTNRVKQIFTINDQQGVLEQIINIKSNLNENLEITGGLERILKQQIEPPINKKTETKPYISAIYNFGEFFIESGYEPNFIFADTSKYYDHTLSFSVGKSELFQFTLSYERRNRVPNWLITELGTDKSWLLAELSLEITSKHNLRIRVGGEKGGLVCSGGVCRFEEPFKGIKIVLTSIF